MAVATGILFSVLRSGYSRGRGFGLSHACGGRRFGAAVLNAGPGSEVVALVIVGEELYVATRRRGRIHVFSFAGEHLRVITGDWREMLSLAYHDGRLYLIECRGEAE